MEASGTLSLILLLLTLIAIVASAVAVARASLSKSTIETLQSSNKALGERVDILERENLRQAAEIVTLRAENKILTDVVNGSEALARIEQRLGQVHLMISDQLA